VTQCAAPGCHQFAAQQNPPITIVGEGFGTFPEGAPFTGTSKYLEIRDLTKKWTAGHDSNACTVSIDEWDTGSIQLVANVDEGKVCPLKSGDTLEVEVWNPQSMASATFQTTVQ
jgi:hypothetical protein